jgi:serine O-acetyltransferase
MTEFRRTPPSDACDPSPAHKASWWRRIQHEVQCCLQDIETVVEHDPAARSRLEVVLNYPGVHAIWVHRVAHRLWRRDATLAARTLSQVARFLTGIEIHPGARIGRGVFIDHGMGVVIGETAQVGDGCILYQGVVLGGTSTERKIRHPQLGKQVVVGSHACVLGAIEVGDGARIGSGSVVIRQVPPEATVVGVPARVVPRTSDKHARFDATLDHANLPDPVAEMVRHLRHQNERLLQRVRLLEDKLGVTHGAETDDEEPHLLDGDLATTDLPRPPQYGG